MLKTSLEALPLKRSQIDQAISTLIKCRPSRHPLEESPQGASPFLALPAEIRNMIYWYCLRMDSDRVPCPSKSIDPIASDKSFNLLQTCRQIHTEARSLLEQKAVAYIPVNGGPNIGMVIYQINQELRNVSIDSSLLTTVWALVNFNQVHFHLHTKYAISEREPDSLDPAFDRQLSNLYSRLRQALLIFTAASPKFVNRQRHAIVHFDHHFTTWKARVAHYRYIYTLRHLINIMGHDTNTNWELRYYETSKWDDLWADGKQRRADNWNEIVSLCKPHAGITPKMEIYGDELPEGEDAYGHTRTITPSSAHWPSWPDKAPWRRQI
ncbi:hypothetical protein K504DRAFT_502133 [Pleomassaria siparia CBS 279.74]|uniref:F-box domain-containing protein n=1 Tax=Pleomassaria siparia CBS 279.74 TaxID=1314801 RepID=A0A6G1K942_9PLEO|nr:hypothetical protein K504DRAFT_502133 [Pleomassaria siparia CBS 279.74]